MVGLGVKWRAATVFIIVVFVGSSSQGPAETPCTTENLSAIVRDPNNCAVYYRCVSGKVTSTGACRSGTVYSLQLGICVPRRSLLDDCSISLKNETQLSPPTGISSPARLSPRDRCVRKDQAFPHPTECGLFYDCSLVCGNSEWTQFLEPFLAQCPPSQWFNSDTLRCENSTSVNCGSRRETEYPYAPPVLTAEGLSPQQACDRGATIFPHPQYCNAYYNCSHVIVLNRRQLIGKFLEQHLMECSYPYLFNAETLRCEEFENVSCGERKETKNYCEYRYSLCATPSHCIPCWARSVVCENVKDGPHYDECNPFEGGYATCKDERMVMNGHYKAWSACGKGEVFSPITLQCVSVHDVHVVLEDLKQMDRVDVYYKVKDMKRG